MSNPVQQALAAVRYREASAFGRWCLTKGVSALPAAPIHVAAFVRDCEPLIPIAEIWDAVQEVSQSHLSNSLADPTAGGFVAEAMNSISQIEPPRSWPKNIWPRFYVLPYDVQSYIAKRSKEQDAVVRRALNEAAEARKSLASIQQPKETPDGIHQDAAA